MTRGRDRGQFVLTAAGVLAVALGAVLIAYLQLGAHPDVAATAHDDPAGNAVRFLDRAVHESDASGRFAWDDRDRAVALVRERLTPRLSTLEASRVARGTAYRVGYNRSAAESWAQVACPRDPARGRVFGPCLADGAVVVQERTGDTHVVAVALDVTVVTDRGRMELTLVVEPVVPAET